MSAAGDQRQRILRAVGELVAEHGYVELTVELIVKRAHVSSRTFYKHYPSKENCFLDLFESAVCSTESIIRTRLVEGQLPWTEKVGLGLRILIERIVAEPIIAPAVIVEAPAAGPALEEPYERARKAFVPLFRAGRKSHSSRPELPATAEDTLSGAVFWSIYQRLAVDEADRLPELLPDLVALIVRTYVGPAEARHIDRDGLCPSGEPLMPEQPAAERPQPPPPQVPRNLETVSARGTVGADWQGELGPLPGGHHGLTRAQIMESQRERLMAALSQKVASDGYGGTNLTDITTLAAVSTRDFYNHFESLEDCYLAAFDAVGDYLKQLLGGAASQYRDWPDQAIAALRAGLDFFAREPDLARLCLVEPVRTTPKIARHFREAVLECLPALARGRKYLAAGETLPASTEDSLIGGVLSLIGDSIRAGESRRLPALLHDLGDFVLSPYLGVERAVELARESPIRSN